MQSSRHGSSFFLSIYKARLLPNDLDTEALSPPAITSQQAQTPLTCPQSLWASKLSGYQSTNVPADSPTWPTGRGAQDLPTMPLVPSGAIPGLLLLFTNHVPLGKSPGQHPQSTPGLPHYLDARAALGARAVRGPSLQPYPTCGHLAPEAAGPLPTVRTVSSLEEHPWPLALLKPVHGAEFRCHALLSQGPRPNPIPSSSTGRKTKAPGRMVT